MIGKIWEYFGADVFLIMAGIAGTLYSLVQYLRDRRKDRDSKEAESKDLADKLYESEKEVGGNAETERLIDGIMKMAKSGGITVTTSSGGKAAYMGDYMDMDALATVEIKEKKKLSVLVCPNCGAPVNGNECEYCGSRFEEVRAPRIALGSCAGFVPLMSATVWREE